MRCIQSGEGQALAFRLQQGAARVPDFCNARPIGSGFCMVRAHSEIPNTPSLRVVGDFSGPVKPSNSRMVGVPRMTRATWKRLCAIASFALFAQPLSAANSGGSLPKPYWAELGVGYARVERHENLHSVGDDSVALDLSGGIRIRPRFRVGLDLGGFTLQVPCLAGVDPYCPGNQVNRGRSIEHLLAGVDFRPQGEDGWLLHGGAGLNAFWAQQAGVSAHCCGWEGEVGTGYTWRIGDSAAHAGIRASYVYGHFEAGANAGIPASDYSAVKVMFLIAYY